MKVYEVIRLINKKLLFIDLHYKRLYKSLEFYGVNFKMSYDEFLKELNSKALDSQVDNFNIRYEYDTDKNTQNMQIIYKEYPTKELYKCGVKTITANLNREDPNIKRDQRQLRELVDELIKSSGSYEVIYLDEGGLKEGSRSNLFFIKNGKLITSCDEDVLKGVTREMVIEVASELGIDVIKRKINYDELKNFDASFLTGTSIHILPIASIDKITYNLDNKVLRRLMNAFEIKVNNYIDR